MSTFLCVLVTFFLGILGSVLNFEFSLNFPDLGTILAITSASGFIMHQIKKKK